MRRSPAKAGLFLSIQRMKTNTLVTHKKFRELGIGCVAKVLKKSVQVNFGARMVKTCDPDELVRIDVKDCKTISLRKYTDRVLMSSGPDMVILGNEVMHFVGIGWTFTRVVNVEDLKKYPRVVD